MSITVSASESLCLRFVLCCSPLRYLHVGFPHPPVDISLLRTIIIYVELYNGCHPCTSPPPCLLCTVSISVLHLMLMYLCLCESFPKYSSIAATNLPQKGFCLPSFSLFYFVIQSSSLL